MCKYKDILFKKIYKLKMNLLKIYNINGPACDMERVIFKNYYFLGLTNNL